MLRKSRLSLETLESRSLMAVDAFLTMDGIPGETKIETAEVGDPTNQPAPTDLSSGEDSGLIGLLVPAVQKVREAAARMRCASVESGDIVLELTDSRGEQMMVIKLQDVLVSSIIEASDEKILIGLLLPAVLEAAPLENSDDMIELENILISSLGEESRPMESLSLNFTKIEFSETEQFELDLTFVEQDAQAYLEYKLKDCLITSYSL